MYCASHSKANEYFVQLKKSEDSSNVFQVIKNITPQKFTHFKAFKTLKENGLDKIYVLNFERELSAEEFYKIRQLSLIQMIEKVPLYEFFYTPNDYSSTSMWNLEKIKAKQAWGLEKGGKNILVALVDDGMDTAHSDLQPTLWKNVNEIPNNNIDDDNNGYIDDIFGWDMADNDNNPNVVASNNLSHGTHCAGIIGAKTDNSNGISSIGFNVKIMPLKCGRNGSSSIFNPYQGVEYAIENGAKIISMSWGGGSFSTTYQLLFNTAAQRNVICVAAAGNSRTNTVMYPAGYKNVISVGSTTNTDAKSSFSNYGTWVDVMAPGSSIYSSIPGNSFGTKSGTSMACPLVSGLCALMLSRNPSMKAVDVEKCLKSSCDNIDSQNVNFIGSIGAGRINAYKALLCIKSVYANFNTQKNFVCTGDTIHYKDRSNPTPSSWLWEFEGGTPNISSNQNPIVRYSSNGVYKTKLTVIKNNDTDFIEKLNYITIGKPEATFSGVQSINKGEYATIKVDLKGLPPWTLIYKDNFNNKDTVFNILQTPYYILKTPDTSVIYKPVSLTSYGCNGTVKDSTRISVTKGALGSVCDSSLRFHSTFGTTSGNHIAYDLKLFNDTNLYVVGNTFNSSTNSNDAYINKYNDNGKLKWSKRFGNGYELIFFTLDIDQNENIYIPSSSFKNGSSSDKMMGITKIDKFGNIKWEKIFNGNSNEYMRNVIVSKFDTKYLYCVGPAVSNSYGGEDIVLIKLDTAGNTIWTRMFGSSITERPEAITEDEFGNIFIGGYTAGSNVSRILLKVSSSGNLLFSNYYAASGEKSYTFSLTNYKKHIYSSGYSEVSNRELCVVKYNLNGQLIWAKKYSANSTNLNISTSNILAHDNKLYVSWSINKSSIDGYVMIIDTNGNVLTYNSIGNSGEDMINGISISSDNSVYYSGHKNSSNKQAVVGKTNCKLKNICQTLINNINVSNLNSNLTNFPLNSGTFNNLTSNSYNNISNNPVLKFECKSNVNIVKKQCKLNADFSFKASCYGDTSTFIGSAFDSNAYSISNWFWNFGDNTSLSGNNKVGKVYFNKGVFQVKMIVTSAFNNQTCADTIVKMIVINDSMKILSMPADLDICKGDSVQISAPDIICGSKPYKYEWLPNIGIDNNTLPFPYFSPKQNTTYTLTIKDLYGNKVKDSLKVNVKQNCCKSIARISKDKENICNGDSVQFINSSTYDASSYFFQWKFSGANLSVYNGSNPPKVVFNGNSGTVELFLSDLCSNDTLKQTYFIFPKPIVNAGNDLKICGLDTVQLGDIALGRSQYSWIPTLGLSNPLISNPELIINKNETYYLKVIDEYSCSNSDSVKITMYEKPPLIEPRDTLICPNDSVFISCKSTGTYLWDNGNTNQSIWVNKTRTVILEFKGFCIYRDTILIGNRVLPAVNLGKDTAFCKNSSIVMRSNIINGHSFLWNTGYIGSEITISQSGKYWLKVSDGKCKTTDTIIIKEFALPSFYIIGDTILCNINNSQLKPNNNFKNAQYEWNTGVKQANLNITKIGNYQLTITDSNMCSNSNNINVRLGQQPIPSNIKDTIICNQTVLILPLPIIVGQSYLWNSIYKDNPYIIKQASKNFLTTYAECGSIREDFEVLEQECVCFVYVPNAFSPNNNNINDKFKLSSTCPLIEFEFVIFNKWGEILFKTNDSNFEWDGKYNDNTVPQNTYFYKLKYRKNQGNISLFEEQNGYFEVIR